MGNIPTVAQGDRFVTVPEAAKRLGKPKMTLYRWLNSGKLQAVTFGGILFVHEEEIERLKTQEAGGRPAS